MGCSASSGGAYLDENPLQVEGAMANIQRLSEQGVKDTKDSNSKKSLARQPTLTSLQGETWTVDMSDEECDELQAVFAEAANLGNNTMSKLIADRLNGTYILKRGCMTVEDPDRLGRFTEKSKSKTSLGDDVVDESSCLVAAGLGGTCRKGLKPHSPNQDAFVICRVDHTFSIYGVFDGHGEHGHSVAEYANDLLPKVLLRDQHLTSNMLEKREAMLLDAFKNMQMYIKSATLMGNLRGDFSGTTGTVVVHDHKSETLTVAHVGDSAAVLGRALLGNEKLMAVELTQDHKPQMNEERLRIESGGGMVRRDGQTFRVYERGGKYPGLNMSRSLGDVAAHENAGLSAEPDVLEHEVGPSDKILLVCSDGVWTFIDPQEAIDIVSEYGEEDAMKAAEALATKAWDMWMVEQNGKVVDDITVIVVYLQH